MPQIIQQYFPHLSEQQIEQFDTMLRLYPEWNAKINVISRRDIDNLETNHLLHSLGIAKFISFSSGSKIMDFGCGGGLPGLPLAVMFPECHFHLIDRTGKKVMVASEISRECGLANVTFQHGDVAECKEKFDFIVSRAVMPQNDLIKICRKNISGEEHNALPNGLITFKGGDLQGELRGPSAGSEVISLEQYFPLPFFDTKKLVYTPLS